MALLNSFNSGVSAVKTFGKSLEVIGDNIANVNTTGFKTSRVTNQDNFSQTFQKSSAGVDGVGSVNPIQIGSGTSIASVSQQFTQGVLSTTGGPADLGISGKGFFKVQDADATTFYTRAGDFRMDDDGFLLTPGGLNLMGAAGPIKIDPKGGTLESYRINKDGTIDAYYSGTTAPSKAVATIQLSSFANPNALLRESQNLLSDFSGAAGVTDPDLTSDIIQGTLELSNVDLTQQFSDLIVAQRAFQAGSRVITVSDSVMEEIVNLKR